jgi:hypothetical protein
MSGVHTLVLVLEPRRHAEDEELERYSLVGIPDEECARLEEHLLLCGACRERLEEHDLIIGAVRLAAERWRARHPIGGKKRRLK